MLSNKKVLITNDDGVFAEGIKHLVKEIYKYTKNIVVIAPKNDSSAISHSITLRDGMKLERIEPIYKDVETYSLSGKPADCVSVGIIYLKLNPDYVISGINNGLNMGIDILYSGTVAACFEAGIHNVKAMAFSCERNEFISARNISDVINYINDNKKLKNSPILNVNMPINHKGCVITVQGYKQFTSEYLLKDGLLYANGQFLNGKLETNESSDIMNYHRGYISITPLTTDRTKY
jgi:5'-nucleotidase